MSPTKIHSYRNVRTPGGNRHAGLVWFIIAAAEQAEVLRRTRLDSWCVIFEKVLTLNSLKAKPFVADFI